jgi:hypothetical protein
MDIHFKRFALVTITILITTLLIYTAVNKIINIRLTNEINESFSTFLSDIEHLNEHLSFSDSKEDMHSNSLYFQNKYFIESNEPNPIPGGHTTWEALSQNLEHFIDQPKEHVAQSVQFTDFQVSSAKKSEQDIATAIINIEAVVEGTGELSFFDGFSVVSPKMEFIYEPSSFRFIVTAETTMIHDGNQWKIMHLPLITSGFDYYH